MCKEDIRIMRKTRYAAVGISVAGVTPVKVLPANADRVAVVLSITTNLLYDGTVSGTIDQTTGVVAETFNQEINRNIRVGYMEGIMFVPLVQANPGDSVNTVHIRDVGQCLCQELFGLNMQNLTTIGVVVDISFKEELKDV